MDFVELVSTYRNENSDIIDVPKVYYICRHHSKPTLKYSHLTGKQLPEKFKWNIITELLHKVKKLAAIKPSFQMAHLLTKQGKLFSNVELIILCLIVAAQGIC